MDARSRWSTRRVAFGLAVGLLAVAALLVWWRHEHRSLSAEERELVGTWVMRQPADDLSVEYEFRADRTCRVVNRDPRTGTVVVEGQLADHWRLSRGELRLGSRLSAGHP